MIIPAISYGFGNENRYNLPQIPESIQLALYKYDLYMQYRSELWESVIENDVKVQTVHLPIDALRRDFDTIFQIIVDGLQHSGCTHYVVHPNKGIKEFIDNFLATKLNVKLCVENFQWRTNKVYRTPLYIAERIMQDENLSMTFDTTHSEDVWFDHRILPFILKHTSVIHLSNRAKGVGQHMPFTAPNGSLNLVKFARELKYKYHWSGIVVLEYMEEYQDKLLKNYSYLKRLIS